MGEGLFELAIDAEPFEGGGEAAGGPGGPELAGRAEFEGGLLGDQQVGVGRVRPADAFGESATASRRGGWRPHPLASAAIQFCQTWTVLGTSGRSTSQRT